MGCTSISVRGLAAIAAVCALFCLGAASASAAPLMLAPNYEQNTVSVFNTQTNEEVGEPIAVGERPVSIAITPDARFAYVVNEESDDVSVIGLARRKVVGEPIEVGESPDEIAISPDGETAYVAHQFPKGISVIDTRTNRVTGDIALGANASGISVSPDGTKVYVTEASAAAVEVISTQTNKAVLPPVNLQGPPRSVAISPDGKTAYAAVEQQGLAVIDTATLRVKYFLEGLYALGVAVTPDGKEAVVTDPEQGGIVLAVDLRTGVVTDDDFGGEEPLQVTITPDGKFAYVTEGLSKIVRVIDIQTFKELGPPIQKPGLGASQVAITPDQSPTAAFTAPSATAASTATFSGAASTDPDGSVVSWNWAFGDGFTDSAVIATHSYATPGTYGAKLSVVDNEGCGESLVFTGRTAYCSGNVGASVTHPVTVMAPVAPIAASPPTSNNFRFGRIVHNRRNGTVRQQVKLPGAGKVLLFGKKVHAVTRKSRGVQWMWLTLHARVELARRLKKTLRAPVKFRLTFTPDGGSSKTVHRSVTLQRAPLRRHHQH
jgi:YVTN family beta-propeller protein